MNEPFVTTPEEVERAVVDQHRAGYDFVKLHGDLSRKAYARLNAIARREGMRVIGHAPRNLGLAALFEERQYALAHAEEFLYDRNNSSRDFARIEPQIPDLARSMARARIWLMPNLTAYKTIGWMVQDLDAVLARPEMRFMPASVRAGWGPATNPYTNRFGKDIYPGIMARYQLLEKLVREFQRGGVRLLIGTDAATANAAEFLAIAGQRGVVAIGQNADLLLLEANPLEKIANSRRIAGVMLRGRWLSRTDIDTILARLASPT